MPSRVSFVDCVRDATHATVEVYLFLATFFSERRGLLNPFTTGNPFLGTKLLGFSIGRISGGSKGVDPKSSGKKKNNRPFLFA